MTDPKSWRIVLLPSVILDDVMMSSLLLLKIICWQTLSFYQINYYVGFFRYDHFEEKIDEIWVLPINSIISRHNDVKLRHCASQVAVL